MGHNETKYDENMNLDLEIAELERAQELINEAIEIIETVTCNDANVQAYLIDMLRNHALLMLLMFKAPH